MPGGGGGGGGRNLHRLRTDNSSLTPESTTGEKTHMNTNL